MPRDILLALQSPISYNNSSLVPGDEQFVFISCGQFSPDEKNLGKEIARIVREQTGLEAFFAEQAQNLNGLDDNILRHLRDCAAFITVLHPRGAIKRPDGSTLVRASVWIEQEVAIATYIQRIEERPIPIIAFKHVSVGREGIRELLQLNPIEFTSESEVLAQLPSLLESLKSSPPQGGMHVQLRSIANGRQEDHAIRKLAIYFANDTNQRITQYSCVIDLPAAILDHWSQIYLLEVQRPDTTMRRFRLTEKNKGPIEPRDRMLLATFEYCTECALQSGLISGLVGQPPISVNVFVNKRVYTINKTTQQLAIEAEQSGAY